MKNYKIKYRQLFFYILSFIFIFFLSSCDNDNPKILIIGDSITMGYFKYVKRELSGEALVRKIRVNAMHTENGLNNIEDWIGDNDWDIIQFNFGLWDLCYRNYLESEEKIIKDKINGKQEIPIERYQSNLDSIVSKLKKTDALLIFVTTAYIPENDPGMFSEDVEKYNSAAKKVMIKNSILVNDIYKKSISIHNKYGIALNNVHYKPKGYKELSKPISSFLREELKKLNHTK